MLFLAGKQADNQFSSFLTKQILQFVTADYTMAVGDLLLQSQEKIAGCSTPRRICATIIVITSVICGISLVIGISSGADAIARSKRPITLQLLHQERVTAGETFQININNQSVSQDDCMSDLCSASLCSKVTLTIDSFSFSSIFTGKLDSSFDRDSLTKSNTMMVTLYSRIIKDSTSYTDWIFHLHRGSTLSITLCAEATGPTCRTAEDYSFLIIRGESNFASWSKTGQFKFVENYTRPSLVTVADCQSQSNALPLYTYSENADYYHVIRSSATFDCDIRVFANATFERKQFNNDYDPSTCTVGSVGIDRTSCTTNTKSIDYVNVKFDLTTEEVDWKRIISFTLFCHLVTNSADLARKVVPAFLVPALIVVMGSIVIVCTCKWYQHRPPYTYRTVN